MRKLLLLLAFVCGSAQAFTQYDKTSCVQAYNEVQQYISQANGSAYQAYKNDQVTYDGYMRIQNSVIRQTRIFIEELRRQSYYGRGFECDRLREMAENTVDSIIVYYGNTEHGTFDGKR